MTSFLSSIPSVWTLWRQGKAPVRLALLVFVVMSCTIAGCRTREHFFDVTGELHVTSAAEHYREALARAKDWKTDAYLTRVRAGVASSSGAPPTGGGLTYMFESPSIPRAFYTLRVTEGTWTSEVISKFAAATHSPIEREDWPLDSVDAWSMALANGGDDFLMDHQEPLTSMDATLNHSRIGEQENVLVWEVDFLILFGPRLLLKIDPKTGHILDVVTD